MNKLDKIKGCLYGGAIGDALGYTIEFNDMFSIKRKYGEKGIENLVLNKENKALISDDTQMTLFTAVGLTEANIPSESYLESIFSRYNEWRITQIRENPIDLYKTEPGFSWLIEKKEMFERRAPGTTCMSSLRDMKDRSIDNPINNSKGCGGVMRVAPIGLSFYKKKDREYIYRLGADAAALTHGNPLGYLPAAILVDIINTLMKNEDSDIKTAVEDSLQILKTFSNCKNECKELEKLIKKAIKLSSNKKINDYDAIRSLGEGWVGEEALAIAIYCSLKYSNNYKKAICAAVNHDGDSDSTGSITGNIVGTYLGYEKIPKEYVENIELYDIIKKVSEDIFRFSESDEEEMRTMIPGKIYGLPSIEIVKLQFIIDNKSILFSNDNNETWNLLEEDIENWDIENWSFKLFQK